MGRTIKKQFWLSREEEEALKRNAEKTCLTETALVRLLITGFEPREKPATAFHQDMNRLSAIGSLVITVLSFVIIMTVYGRFFKLYMYTAIAPIPLATVAGQPTQHIGISFLKSYAAVCMEGAIILLACVIFSIFAASPPVVDAEAAPAAMVWSYLGELIFNMLILVGTIKLADRVVREMMGL